MYSRRAQTFASAAEVRDDERFSIVAVVEEIECVSDHLSGSFASQGFGASAAALLATRRKLGQCAPDRLSARPFRKDDSQPASHDLQELCVLHRLLHIMHAEA